MRRACFSAKATYRVVRQEAVTPVAIELRHFASIESLYKPTGQNGAELSALPKSARISRPDAFPARVGGPIDVSLCSQSINGFIVQEKLLVDEFSPFS